MPRSLRKLIDEGVRIADSPVFRQDKIWSRYSNDKVDIGETLARVIRTLSKALPLDQPLHALSIGSSNEPQFRILQSAFSGRLFLLDVEREALDTVKERIRRQHTENVATIQGDYTRILSGDKGTERFRERQLGGRPMELVTLQHSLYYCPFGKWMALAERLVRHLLAPTGAVHLVLMSAQSDDPQTTTWLYNHFAGRFAGHENDQCLKEFRDRMADRPAFGECRLMLKTSRVRFFVDDFKKFMAVVWMILLHPQVHAYSLEQRREITEHVYQNFYRAKKPLIQSQEHLVLYRGIPGPVLV